VGPGTIAHEYGEDDCKALAKSDYAKALGNADRLQYFFKGISNE
jgi:hypothetical protein